MPLDILWAASTITLYRTFNSIKLYHPKRGSKKKTTQNKKLQSHNDNCIVSFRTRYLTKPVAKSGQRSSSWKLEIVDISERASVYWVECRSWKYAVHNYEVFAVIHQRIHTSERKINLEIRQHCELITNYRTVVLILVQNYRFANSWWRNYETTTTSVSSLDASSWKKDGQWLVADIRLQCPLYQRERERVLWSWLNTSKRLLHWRGNKHKFSTECRPPQCLCVSDTKTWGWFEATLCMCIYSNREIQYNSLLTKTARLGGNFHISEKYGQLSYEEMRMTASHKCKQITWFTSIPYT